MDQPPQELMALLAEARSYELQGDAYNAIKLYKKVAKLAPEWAPPVRHLGVIYKYRREWKPALHYLKRSLALEPGNPGIWWDLGIVAVALKKWRIARNVWNKFGQTPAAGWAPGPVAIRLTYEGQYEILWADRLDPVRAVIQNIPHPASGRSFRDVILCDQKVSGYHVVQQKRFPVFEELGVVQRSGYLTYSCLLETDEVEPVLLLERLCQEADIGFEIWSNASRSYTVASSSSLPEYYHQPLDPGPSGDSVLVALAARREKQILQLLNSWEVISLRSYSQLQCHP